MNTQAELRARAIKLGIFVPRETTLTRLVQKIQEGEGHNPCFRTEKSEVCAKWKDCEWKNSCAKTLVAQWLR